MAAEPEPRWVHVCAGSLSRVTLETSISPLLTVKVRMQSAQTGHDAAALDFIRRTKGGLGVFRGVGLVARAEGVGALFRGLPPRLTWAAPLSAVGFAYYEEAKTLFDFDSVDAGGGRRALLLAGPVALATGIAARTPFDVIEQWPSRSRSCTRGGRGVQSGAVHGVSQ